MLLAAVASPFAAAQNLYKYKGENGEWIFTDRAPDEGQAAEVRLLDPAQARGKVTITNEMVGDKLILTAHNSFYAPMQMAFVFDELDGVQSPDPENPLHWVIPARGDLSILELQATKSVTRVAYHFVYLPGDPDTRHQPTVAYRVPYPVGTNFPVSQTYPDTSTHTTADSQYAIDIAMPIGTDIVAARAGVVFDIAADNYRSGFDMEKNGPGANIVRILHDDGTYAAYAHLNWNSIRVRPGDFVNVGEYIADSGNTGFSSGPHLHFVVQRNAGMKVSSVPVAFRGPTASDVVPKTGNVLTAYP